MRWHPVPSFPFRRYPDRRYCSYSLSFIRVGFGSLPPLRDILSARSMGTIYRSRRWKLSKFGSCWRRPLMCRSTPPVLNAPGHLVVALKSCASSNFFQECLVTLAWSTILYLSPDDLKIVDAPALRRQSFDFTSNFLTDVPSGLSCGSSSESPFITTTFGPRWHLRREKSANSAAGWYSS
jgi:hypothetical protein